MSDNRNHMAQALAESQSGMNTTLEFKDLLRILNERRLIIAAGALLGLLLGLLLAFTSTPLYRATALLQYDPQATESLDQTKGAGVGRAYIANQEVMATQMGLLRSEALARRTAEELNLAVDPQFGGKNGTQEERVKRAANRILGGTEVEIVKGSMLFRLSFSSTDPQISARIASGLAQGFIASSMDRRYNSSAYARRFLSDQLAKTKSALEESEQAVNAYAISSQLFRTPGQVSDGKTTEGTTLSVNDLTAMQTALNEAKVARIAAESAYLSGASANQNDMAQTTAPLIQQRATLQAEYAENSRIFKADYPKMQELSAQIARLDGVIDNERKHAIGDQRSQLQANFRAAQKAEADLTARVYAIKASVQRERSSSIRYNILQREVDTNRALYDALLQRFKEVGVAGGIGKSNISLVDDAQIPRAPYSPKWTLNAAVGLIFGLFAGIAVAFVMHMLFDTLIAPADVRSRLHLPVLGVIPMETDGLNLGDVVADRKSSMAEAYYSMLTALKFARPEGMPKTVFITSSNPAEGKSTSAYATAVSSARLGQKVLLIDADLRRPTFSCHREDERGFAYLLGSEAPIKDYIQPSALDELKILPVGAVNGSAAELLSSLRLPSLIKEAAQHFDFVVLDGPPVLGLTDSPLLSSATDATVVVVESRKTHANSAMDMVRRLRDAGGNIVGVLLTKVSRQSSGYGYGGYYQYNYHAYGNDTSGSTKEKFDPAAYRPRETAQS